MKLKPASTKRVEQLERHRLIGGPAEHVAAEHQRRDFQAGIAELALFHGFSREVRVGRRARAKEIVERRGVGQTGGSSDAAEMKSGTGLKHMSLGLRTPEARDCRSGELPIQRDLGVQHLGDRAAGLGALGDLLELVLGDVGHAGFQLQRRLG